MGLKRTLPFTVALFFHTQSIGQYAADGSQGTFYSVVNASKNYIERTEKILLESEPSIAQIPHFKTQLQETRKSIERWTNLIEELTNLGNLAIGSVIGTISLIFIMQVTIYILHYSRKICCN